LGKNNSTAGFVDLSTLPPEDKRNHAGLNGGPPFLINSKIIKELDAKAHILLP
jgi:hypothetical protein